MNSDDLAEGVTALADGLAEILACTWGLDEVGVNLLGHTKVDVVDTRLQVHRELCKESVILDAVNHLRCASTVEGVLEHTSGSKKGLSCQGNHAFDAKADTVDSVGHGQTLANGRILLHLLFPKRILWDYGLNYNDATDSHNVINNMRYSTRYKLSSSRTDLTDFFLALLTFVFGIFVVVGTFLLTVALYALVAAILAFIGVHLWNFVVVEISHAAWQISFYVGWAIVGLLFIIKKALMPSSSSSTTTSSSK